MELQGQDGMKYLMTPRTKSRPVKMDKILAERLRRHRQARELRLSRLERP